MMSFQCTHVHTHALVTHAEDHDVCGVQNSEYSSKAGSTSHLQYPFADTSHPAVPTLPTPSLSLPGFSQPHGVRKGKPPDNVSHVDSGFAPLQYLPHLGAGKENGLNTSVIDKPRNGLRPPLPSQLHKTHHQVVNPVLLLQTPLLTCSRKFPDHRETLGCFCLSDEWIDLSPALPWIPV